MQETVSGIQKYTPIPPWGHANTIKSNPIPVKSDSNPFPGLPQSFPHPAQPPPRTTPIPPTSLPFPGLPQSLPHPSPGVDKCFTGKALESPENPSDYQKTPRITEKPSGSCPRGTPKPSPITPRELANVPPSRHRGAESHRNSHSRSRDHD